METVITLKNVSKKYADRIAVSGVNLEIKKGECIGFIGPNGAGKSSLLKMIYCNTGISGGEIYVLGLNAKKNSRDIKSRIGIVPQEDNLDSDFSAFENLLVYANYFGIVGSQAENRANELLNRMKIEEYKNFSIDQLSGGTKRKLSLARALMNEPEILFLDEPTTGLDLRSSQWLWSFIHTYNKEGFTVVLTTHFLEEAEEVCNRVAIIDEGRIVTDGKPTDLVLNNYGKRVFEFEVQQNEVNYYLNRLQEMKLAYQVIGNSVIVESHPDQDGQVLSKLISSEKLLIRKPTLNDVFIKLTGRQIKENDDE